MDAINKTASDHGIPVLEDSAQSHGATLNGKKAGALGHAACFSFYPGKNLGAYGDAGAVVSNDKEFIAKVRQIANHGGGANKYDNVILGTNSRLDTMQAAILRAKLKHLPQWTEERRERAALYSKLLDGVPGLVTPKEGPGARSAWHLYTVRTARREALIEELKKNGISTAVHYPRPIHLQPAMGAAGGQAGDLPVSENLSRAVVCLPLYPELPLEEIERIAGVVRAFLSA
jgi:dTDP-4-amino-4,6-dideoxygalactose transaminase